MYFSCFFFCCCFISGATWELLMSFLHYLMRFFSSYSLYHRPKSSILIVLWIAIQKKSIPFMPKWFEFVLLCVIIHDFLLFFFRYFGSNNTCWTNFWTHFGFNFELFREREIAFCELYLPMHAIVLVDDRVQWKRVDVIITVYQQHDVHQMVFEIHALMEFLMMPCHLIVSIRVQSARKKRQKIEIYRLIFGFAKCRGILS